MNLNYPILFEPVLKNYVWGGRNIEKLGRTLPGSDRVAESWEISAHEDGITKIANGKFAGMTLQDLFEQEGVNLVGTNNQWALDRRKFPLLIKLLDAEERLSVQVHPDDNYAKSHEKNELGKSEMWVVLDAKPGAAIIYGLKKDVSPIDFRKAIDQENLEPYLNVVSIKSGDHICVPSGTLHAILEGALIAEIQQNSNTTYRVYDWNRKDQNGKSREIHIDKAIDVIKFSQVGKGLNPPEIINSNPVFIQEKLCTNKYFTTERFTARKNFTYSGNCDGSTLEIWGVIQGEAVFGEKKIRAVNFCLLPAVMGSFSIEIKKTSVLLRIYTSNN